MELPERNLDSLANDVLYLKILQRNLYDESFVSLFITLCCYVVTRARYVITCIHAMLCHVATYGIVTCLKIFAINIPYGFPNLFSQIIESDE